MIIKNINWEELTPELATRYFLFGEENKPSAKELVDEKWIHRKSNFAVRIVNMDSYMENGPGRFANASEIPAIVEFFNLRNSTKELEDGEYGLSEISEILNIDSNVVI